MTRAAAPQPRSRLRNVVYLLLTVLLVFLALEIGSGLLLSLAAGHRVSLEEVRSERAALLAAGPEGDPFAAVRKKDRRAGFKAGREAIHPFLGFVEDPERHPGAQQAGSDPEANAFGFLGNTNGIFHRRSPDKVLIAVLGGSFADIAATGGGRLASHLRKIERFRDQEVVVVSLAVPGYKQPQQLMTLNYLLALGAEFDIVLNIDGFNEVALTDVEVVPFGIFPAFPRSWDLRVGDLDPEARTDLGELAFLRRRRAERARWLESSWLRHSRTAAVIWKIADRSLAGRVARAEQALADNVRRSRRSYQAVGPRRRYRSRKEMFRDVAALWKRSSLLLHQLCRSHRIEYHHFLQPNQYLPDSKPLDAEKEAGKWVARHHFRPAVEEGYPWLVRAGRALLRKKVRFHDMTAMFADDERLLYNDHCCHLNGLGNDLFQQAVAEILDRKGRESGG